MGTGYFLVRGDKTTCGGKIIEGADDHTIMGIPQARDMDRVTCGRYPGMFIIECLDPQFGCVRDGQDGIPCLVHRELADIQSQLFAMLKRKTLLQILEEA